MRGRKAVLSMHCSAALAGILPSLAVAADLALVGLMADKALVVIDGGRRQLLSVGERSAEGVKLVAIEAGAAVFESDGKRRRIEIGQSVVSVPKAEKPALVLTADAQGHFVTSGSINGEPMRFLVDTGATFVSLGAADARRARVDLGNAKPAMTQTANGMTRVWRVRLTSVRVGNITLRDVEATVHEHDMPVVLLGMSFLKRMEMRRDGTTLSLVQRY
ncbi:retropepsin-like aspartic protease family protein [Sulfuricystis multivorans]|uniref:retropepsin-like aspartic protease family protein n=1 Tax=Sulfuricystis multivorans TaxID=2211108 RepID=UPI0024DFCDCA|nr:TIGR02281 family clan AA aspartic protease [Sulfuricystis multivorans]